ncbi:MAG: GyrI-like domain-containing protein [Spirochaetota bacterium]
MEIKEVKEQNSLSIRLNTPVQELTTVFGEGYKEIGDYMESLGIYPIGPPFAIYYNEDMSNLDIEFGFPVAEKKPDKGRIKAGLLPGGKAISTVHIGSYESIEDTYNKIGEWAKDNNYETESYCYEFYLTDPATTSPDKLKTEIRFPLK